jgi:ElaA protein
MTDERTPQVSAADVTWRWLAFDQLSVGELYRAMTLRQQVFVVEQNCVYLDADGHDPVSIHGLGEVGEGLVAYARVLPPGVTFGTPSIGRLVTAPAARSWGLGRPLMQQAIAESERRYPGQPITIGAQLYLRAFYESLGFEVVGEPYDEDGIMHVDMIRSARS